MINHISKPMYSKFFYQNLGKSPNTIRTVDVKKSVNICTIISKNYQNSNEVDSIIRNSILQPYHIRGFKNLKSKKPLKTKQAAAKRFIRTGKGKLKFGHSGKAHLNIGKSKVRLARLNSKSHLTGTNFKNMKKMFMYGK